MAEALARLGIQADILRVSPYKTAYDTLTRQEMSAEAREMGNWLIESVYEQLVEAIAEGRGIEPEAARGAIDATPCTDLEAQELGLIDALVSEPDLPAHLAEEGAEAAELVTWPKGHRRLRPESPAPPLRYVALMGVEGLIVPGHSQQPPGGPPAPSSIAMQRRAGDRSVVEVARKIAADSRAAAVVLYIDSRGGTSSASEAMRAALQRLADSKPLLVVMGGYAASGGYLVALPGQAVFAQPNTITGSIGVLGGKIASVDLLDRLHANREVITRGEHALFYDFQKPFDPQEREIVRRLIGRTYDLFVDHVAQARELERADVEAMAGGRVWTGRQALDKGLVDEYGGLTHALDLARAQAKLHARAPVRVYHPSKEPTAPRAEPAAAVAYLLEGLSILQRAGSLTLCDLFWDGDDGLL
jgi:protease-4